MPKRKKHMNKKLIFFSLLFALTLLFSGCAPSSANGPVSSSNASDSSALFKDTDGSLGSGKHLAGVCTAIPIFVDDTQTAWTETDKERAVALCQKAARYLVKQAERYDVALDLRCNMDYALSCTLDQPVPVEMTSFSWTTEVQKRAGTDTFCAEKGLDNVIFLLLVPQEGRSYSLPYTQGVDTKYYNENVVIYMGDCSDTTLPATIAHEMLHPFGADDLYFPYDSDTSRAELAATYFPDDIMLRVDPLLSTLTVGPYTAYNVGWTDTLDPKYEIFLDKGDASDVQR